MIDGRTLTARLKKTGFKNVVSRRTSVRGFHTNSKGDFSCTSFINNGTFYDLGKYDRVIRVELYDKGAEILDVVRAMDDVTVLGYGINQYNGGYIHIKNA